jgi:sugar/nucleoside kinase (ribokinase family)
MKSSEILSVGTMYLDINCVNFPFDQGLFAHRETVGSEYHVELGGSALNFAKIAAQLGMDVSFLGKAGEDEIGSMLVGLMRQNDIKPMVVFDRSVQTNIAMHYIHEDGSSIMTSSGSANQSLTFEDIQSKIVPALDSIDYLYLGGVLKLKDVLPDLKYVAKLAQEKGVAVVVDHGRINNKVTSKDLNNLRGLIPYTDIYLPSIDEFLTVWESDTPQEGYAKMSQVAQPLTIIKRAEQGAIGFDKGRIFTAHPYTVNVINTVGAGDSFNAGILKARSDGKDVGDSMQFACAVASAKISTTGKLSIGRVNQLIKTT